MCCFDSFYAHFSCEACQIYSFLCIFSNNNLTNFSVPIQFRNQPLKIKRNITNFLHGKLFPKKKCRNQFVDFKKFISFKERLDSDKCSWLCMITINFNGQKKPNNRLVWKGNFFIGDECHLLVQFILKCIEHISLQMSIEYFATDIIVPFTIQ